ncbi:MAG TPA: DUF222 domain-containing protein [Actinomycetes bacterium]|nr:DUF222 domain-containing protein [Actinomycetes bacterium]
MGHESDPPEWADPGVPRCGDGAPLIDQARQIFDEFVAAAEGQKTEGQLVAMRTALDRLEGLWLDAGADFAASGELADTGHPTFASWMRHRCRLAPAEASARAGVANSLAETSPARCAVRGGAISWRHAQVIAQTLPKVPAERRDEAERALLDKASKLDPGQLRRVADRLVHCFDRDAAEEASIRRWQRRGLSVAETYDGMVSVSGLLDPLTGATLLTALAARTRPRSGGVDHGDGHATASEGGRDARDAKDARTPAQRRADALAEICSEWLAFGETGVVGGARPHVSVIVRQETLAAGQAAATEAGQLSWVGPVTATEAQLISCDSVVSRVVLSGESHVIDVGRATRTIPPALRRAVAARDGTCVGPGCQRLPEQCDVHHIVFWEHGGETSRENTVLLCRYHHQLVHRYHWRVVMDTTGRRSLAPPR